MTLQRNMFAAILVGFLSQFLFAQKPYQPNAAEILDQINRLNVLGTAMYVAAHPDDENQRLISYLSNHKGYQTTYVSLTRGDGGQNRIGTEIREELGVIRTLELLGARSIDGGQQRFTRAIDFGYSKHPDETFAIWDKEAVLGDLVYAIRELKPDFIFTRFDHRTPGKTHGHHTGSAMLGQEAFDLAGDPNAYPEHLTSLDPWQPATIFMNTSWWFYGSKEKFAEVDKTNLYAVDVGVYYPLKGKSNTEISQEARSMHKCQGFGATGYRGVTEEWLEYIKGVEPSNENDVFESINTSWSRIDGGQRFSKMVTDIKANFSFTDPSLSVPGLVALYQELETLSDPFWKNRKQKDVKKIIKECMGLYIETSSISPSAVTGDSVFLNIEAINRSSISCLFDRINTLGIEKDLQVSLSNNEVFTEKLGLVVGRANALTSPFWLKEKGSLGLYHIDNPTLRTQPSNNHLVSELSFDIEGQNFNFQIPIVYKWNDPVAGESHKPFAVTYPVSISMKDDSYLFKSNETKQIKVSVQSWADKFEGRVELQLPLGWSCHPQHQDVSLNQYLENVELTFDIQHELGASNGHIKPQITSTSGKEYSSAIKLIEYDHIPAQMIQLPTSANIIHLDIETRGELLGYVMGAGDDVPKSLEIMGYQVDLLGIDHLQAEQLKKYDAIVVGIRAFNTLDALRYKNKELFEYAHQGGTVIVQYNTRHRLKTEDIAPYTIKLSRDRVTDEFSDVRFISPDHQVLNEPNKITQGDFENWVQERGLYFPEEWDPAFTPIIAWNDKGEDSKEGALLVAKHGAGHYIYTGISFFRELPAGVTGAYRLLANLIAIGEDKQ